MRLTSGAMVCVLAVSGACGPTIVTTPPVVVAPPPTVPLDRKLAWIARLEQQRVVRDGATTPAIVDAALPRERSFAPAMAPDLEALSRDPDASIRRRAVVALGRVGAPEATPTLVAALRDAEPEVRASAAFALGLLGAKESVGALVIALKDSSAIVRARVIEGLGLIGDASAAGAIADAATGCGALMGPIEPDDESPKSADVEVCRLALFSLVRLKNYDALARVALDPQGGPVAFWWPVAFALQRIGDPRAVPALVTLAATPTVTTAAFAIRGLAAAKDARVVSIAAGVASRNTADVKLRVAAVRALGQMSGKASVDALMRLVDTPTTPPNLALEAMTSLGAIASPSIFNALLGRLSHPVPAMRAATLAAAAKSDPDGFLLVVSGIGRDPHWSVRAAFAGVLATLPVDRVSAAIDDLTQDEDLRVRGPALEALAAVKGPTLAKRLLEALDSPDVIVRATAAGLYGAAKVEGGVTRLSAVYDRAQTDAAYDARAAALDGAAAYASEDAKALIRRALADSAWAVRVHAADLLQKLGDASARPLRPAPLRQPAGSFEAASFLHPPYSPHAFLETRRGTIEIELNVIEAPTTSQTFIELARAGHFNGTIVHRLVPNFVIQTGDPRGDGEGGPGFTQMDELSPLAYVRGTVGMALEWRDTGGSQFFITLSPQPHLDGKYTVFGKVVGGFDLLDDVLRDEVIERVRIWDGVSSQIQ